VGLDRKCIASEHHQSETPRQETEEETKIMLRSRLIRMSIAAAAAVAVPLGGAVIFDASPASAAFVGIKCTTITGTVSGTVTVSGCNGNTGGSSTTMPTSTLLSGGTVTWVNTKTTTIGSPTVSSVTGSAKTCTSTQSEEKATGAVTADTTGSAPVPGAYKIFVCVTSKGKITDAPGKKVKIG
jgi:hypothetical protein